MPKYLIQVSYKTAGAKGLLIDGGMKRRAMAKELAEGLGGKLEMFYFAFGETDVFAIMDLPDDVAIAAAALAINASGSVTCKTTVLLTTEEIDQATKKIVEYRPPGQ
jgi:uncharacterized protein with GYD domain